MSATSSGTLYVVGTPIGNLGDLSARARSVLGAVDLIAAEDTRRTRGLLSSIELNATLMAYHEHNEQQRTPVLIARLQQGDSVALVSDAGMPSISDPGLRLVRAALAEKLPVVSVPGPTAVIAALTICGLATDRFVFEGFLPRRSGPRRQRVDALLSESRTMVFYEAVHRIAATLETLAGLFGPDRPAAIARELTKLHERVYTGTLAGLKSQLGNEIPLKGEFVLLVAGSADVRSASTAEAQRIFAILSNELSAKAAVALTAKITGLSRNDVYQLTRLPD
ncbi:MAG: 16S rRNA (cytidine(1402)-2'-O)-methyltransferase [Gammaproteobacteria bacterium]|nr:16S rRNA (cytidine(1402)-2'-O)-methyltransferase [Gammaproteobacteria bacterium]